MRRIEPERKIGNNCFNICSSNVPFNKISSDEEIHFVLNKKLTKEPKIHYCLIAFGTSSTLLTFGEKYLEYSDKYIETKGLSIGGYEVTFLAGLVASCLFEECNNQSKEVPWKGIYICYGFLVFEGKQLLSEIKI